MLKSRVRRNYETYRSLEALNDNKIYSWLPTMPLLPLRHHSNSVKEKQIQYITSFPLTSTDYPNFELWWLQTPVSFTPAFSPSDLNWREEAAALIKALVAVGNASANDGNTLSSTREGGKLSTGVIFEITGVRIAVFFGLCAAWQSRHYLWNRNTGKSVSFYSAVFNWHSQQSSCRSQWC